MSAPFKVGDRVRMPAFTDCFEKPQPARENLTVISLQLITPAGPRETLQPYYRIAAGNSTGFYEAAARFFEPIPEETSLQLARDRQQQTWNDAELQIQNRYNVLAYWDSHVDRLTFTDLAFYGPAFRETQEERHARLA